MIAKASTTCTYSLDPIALWTPERESSGRAKRYCRISKFALNLVENLVDAITIDMCSSHTSIDFYGLVKNSRFLSKE